MLATVLLSCALAGDVLSASLDRAPERKAEWQAIVSGLPRQQRAAAAYLMSYMPLEDLKTLKATSVGEAVQLSYKARKATAWGRHIPQDVFFEGVLPYANVTEPRESMRAEFQDRYLPLVAATKTPGEAALLINRSLFRDYHVSYNEKRKHDDQSSKESVALGMATCTGLSVMLVDALRAVGVPCHLAGIPSWPGRGGNHTWVEVWDNGQWHFVGAAEPDAKGLDHAWFAGEAAGAIADQPMHAIYAISYRPTGTNFPMFWAPDKQVPGENVTQRYRRNAKQ